MKKQLLLRFLNIVLAFIVLILFAVRPLPVPGQASAASTLDYWPMFGHDSAHTSRSSVNGPNTANLAWTYNDGQGIVGDVVVGPDGTIYGISFDKSYTIFQAINPDGTSKWKINLGLGVYLGTPAVAPNGTIYLGIPDGYYSYLVALDTQGDVIWSYTVDGNIRTAITIGPDGTIYFGTDFSSPGTIYALNPDGTEKWEWKTPSGSGFESTGIAVSPYNGDVVFRCSGVNCSLVALTSGGSLHWATHNDDGNRDNSPSIGPDGTVYIGRRDYLYRAYDPNDGSIKWAADTAFWMNGHAAAISADGSTIYTGDNGGIFYAFDKTGSLKWYYDTGLSDYGAGLGATPLLSANGIVYFTSDSSTATPDNVVGKIYALRADTGTLVWSYDVGWGASPAMGPDGTLYVTAYTGDPPNEIYHLYAFRCADGLCALPPLPAPASFNKSSPNHQASKQALTPTLRWDASTRADYYEYCYDTSNDNTCTNWTKNGTSTSKTLSGLAPHTTYYWHVRAVNSGGSTYSNGSETTFWSFTTGYMTYLPFIRQ